MASLQNGHAGYESIELGAEQDVVDLTIVEMNIEIS